MLISSKGVAKRDIVQFVPYNKFAGHPEDLAAAVLEELPEQVTSFYRMIGKAPNPPVIDSPSQYTTSSILLFIKDWKAQKFLNYAKFQETLTIQNHLSNIHD
jgi:Copine